MEKRAETKDCDGAECAREDVEDEESAEVNRLLKSVPALNDMFHIHRKVGEGTFSSVFLGTLKSSSEKKKFAIKHLVPVCHPDTMKRELEFLQEIGGQDHVVGLQLCLRNSGSLVFVMPYMRHDKFVDYVQNMSVEETKDYMRALLTALRRVHQFDIIHRDVKPSNFLYDRRNRRYLLVDFGLAQRYDAKKKAEKPELATCVQLKRKRSDENRMDVSLNAKNAKACYCFGKPTVCSLCLSRPNQTAPRAGTPGFRAPEVLLKYPYQTPAIDIWACGVMMLCILSSVHPFFRSPDDCTALAEITTIFGANRMQQCARKLGKKLLVSEDLPGIDIASLCQKLQRRKAESPENADQNVPDTEFPAEAYHLATRLLDVDYKTRITAEQALQHAFLKR